MTKSLLKLCPLEARQDVTKAFFKMNGVKAKVSVLDCSEVKLEDFLVRRLWTLWNRRKGS